MKKIVLELDRGWVLRHRDDDTLPIELIKNEIGKLDSVEVKGSTFYELNLVVDEKKLDLYAVEKKLVEIFSKAYPSDDADAVLSLQIDEGAEGDSEEQAPRKADLSSKAEKREEADINDELANVNKLVGASEFKSLVNEIVRVAPEIKENNCLDVFFNQSYLFSIGDGCGLSTYVNLLAGVISRLKLAKIAPRPVVECALGAYKEGMEPFENALRILDNGNSDKVRVLCIDISEWLDKTDSAPFKKFLKAVEKSVEEYIIVFRVPFVDKDVLERLKFSLNDLLSIKAISVPPLNEREIEQIAKNEITDKGFSVVKTAWPYFHQRISIEKSDGKFYGLNTVKKVVRELIYSKQLSNAGKEKKSMVISNADMSLLCGSAVGSMTGMEQLEKMVGIENIKARLDEIIAQIEISVREKSADRPCIHMRFVGPPGTGKTTVARIVGRILKEKGVLRIGNFYEVAARDLCGRYVGETAPKTQSICRDAYGSVLFIDEAYALYRGDDNPKDYGREAIDTLIAELENHRNDFVVIMAGYADDMDKLMGANQGLASRMPYTIEFPNFTRSQLYEIYASMAEDGFKYDKSLLEAAKTYFEELPDDIIGAKEFSNARYVRNLYERTWAKAAMRSQLSGERGIVLTKEDFERASAEKEFAFKVPKKTRIGF